MVRKTMKCGCLSMIILDNSGVPNLLAELIDWNHARVKRNPNMPKKCTWYFCRFFTRKMKQSSTNKKNIFSFSEGRRSLSNKTRMSRFYVDASFQSYKLLRLDKYLWGKITKSCITPPDHFLIVYIFIKVLHYLMNWVNTFL